MSDGQAPDVLDAYAVRLGGCRLLLASRQACLDVLRSLQAAVAASDRAGLRPPPRIVTLIAALEAEMQQPSSPGGSAEVPREPGVPGSVLTTEPADTKEAARMLGVTPRQIRNISHRLDGRKVAGSWVFDRDLVAAEAIRRQRKASQ
ncbi:helix-turn-helix domain-containing protein [Micromonospora sp. WMMA1996]|uniref:helix-turn-helix domain-containing protein n=1 Tax=Micromonospora sp. WMMA1996 TaxID=2039878 RepID=UPI001145E914|nr:helix-turn-helix domain-containing protein [Micromonospora sp. WMMA1996]